MAGEARSCDGGLGKRSKRSPSSSDSEIISGRSDEKDTFFFVRRGCGRWMMDGDRVSEAEEVGESRMEEGVE